MRRQLESLDFIKDYRANIDLEALGFSITAFVRLPCDGRHYKPFLKFLEKKSSPAMSRGYTARL